MRTGRSYVATAVAFGFITLTGCAVEDEPSASDEQVPQSNDWGDPDAYPELGGAYHSLTAFDGTCAWNSTTGAMTVTATGNVAQTIIIGGRVDNYITVNGNALCGTSTVPKASLKTIQVGMATSPVDSAAQTVIFDFINYFFASGTTAGAGIKVDLKGGSDAVKIRGTGSADAFTFGHPAVAATTPAGTVGVGLDATNRDIDALNVESFAVSLAGGNDTFAAGGGTPVGTNSTAILTLPLTVNGGAGNDVITTGGAADTLNGGAGNDTLKGEAGNDMLVQSSVADGADVLDCGNESSFVEGAETDLVDYSARTTTASVTVTLATLGGTANDGSTSEGDDVADNCEQVKGGWGGDTITGDSHYNVLYGGAGNDTLAGGAGVDTLNGEAGDDTFNEGTFWNGGDTLNGGAGTDTVSYASRSVTVTISVGTAASGEASEADTVASDVENLTGGPGDDTITGSTADNVITGGAGNDTLSGGDGNDTFDEGAAVNGGDTFNGGNGTDTVDYHARTMTISVTIGVGANDGLAETEGDDVGSTVENVVGSSTMANDLMGSSGNNELTGGSAADVLAGGDGDDILDGGSGGADTLDCGLGEDISYGGSSPTVIACEL